MESEWIEFARAIFLWLVLWFALADITLMVVYGMTANRRALIDQVAAYANTTQGRINDLAGDFDYLLSVMPKATVQPRSIDDLVEQMKGKDKATLILLREALSRVIEE